MTIAPAEFDLCVMMLGFVCAFSFAAWLTYLVLIVAHALPIRRRGHGWAESIEYAKGMLT